MNQRALDLAMVLRGQLVSLGPGVCSVSAREIATWMLVKIGMVTADTARVFATDLGIEQARTSPRPRAPSAWRRSRWRDGSAAAPCPSGGPPGGRRAVPRGDRLAFRRAALVTVVMGLVASATRGPVRRSA